MNLTFSLIKDRNPRDGVYKEKCEKIHICRNVKAIVVE